MEIDTLFAAEAHAAERGAPRARGGHAAYIVVIVVLLLVCAGLGAAYVQTRQEARDWADAAGRRSSELQLAQQERKDVDERLAQSETALVAAKDSLASTTSRLEEASAKVKTLTEEKAKMLDKGTFIPAALAMSDQLVQELNTCIGHVQGLRGSLAQEGVEPAIVMARAAEVDGSCDQAKADSAAFQSWLGSQ